MVGLIITIVNDSLRVPGIGKASIAELTIAGTTKSAQRRFNALLLTKRLQEIAEEAKFSGGSSASR